MDFIGTFTSGTLFGIMIGKIIDHFLNKSRAIELRRKVRREETSTIFRTEIIKEIAALYLSDKRLIETRNQFIALHIAMTNFKPFLTYRE